MLCGGAQEGRGKRARTEQRKASRTVAPLPSHRLILSRLARSITRRGRIQAMKTTIDVAGRLVIPKEIRRLAGIEPGMPLKISWQDGRIEIEPAAMPIRLVSKGRLLVAVPETEVEPLTAATVEATRQALQDERGFGV